MQEPDGGSRTSWEQTGTSCLLGLAAPTGLAVEEQTGKDRRGLVTFMSSSKATYLLISEEVFRWGVVGLMVTR